MADTDLQNQDEQNVKKAAAAFDDFMSTMDELSKAQQTAIAETSHQLEAEKLETLKKQIQAG